MAKMTQKQWQSIKKAGKIAEERGLTAYEGATIYKRYMLKDGTLLDSDANIKIYNGLLDMYTAFNCRYLLHELDTMDIADFEIETDRR